MTISELTLKSSDVEPVRRFEVFTGTGRWRDWPPEEKARIVAESYERGGSVSAVARRYALSLRQLFAWRRAARRAVAETTTSEPSFVPAVVAAPAPMAKRPTQPRRQKAAPDAFVIYSHYTGKEDLLRKGFQALRTELAEAQRAAGAKTDRPLGFSLAMFEHADAYKSIYRALVGGRGSVIALNEIRRTLSEIVKKELSGAREDEAVPQEVRTQFVVGAFLTVLMWWLERRPRLTPSQVDAIFRRLALNGIGPSIRAPRQG